jgi:serine/threonine protein kinase
MYMLIEGKHPLYESQVDNEKSFLQKLRDPHWRFSQSFTPLAKDFFLKLCNPSPIERYTSDKALRHPWVTRDFAAPIPLT